MAWLWPRHQIPIAFNAVYVALFVFLRSRPSQQKPSGTEGLLEATIARSVVQNAGAIRGIRGGDDGIRTHDLRNASLLRIHWLRWSEVSEGRSSCGLHPFCSLTR
jgi:hypothetical protein